MDTRQSSDGKKDGGCRRKENLTYCKSPNGHNAGRMANKDRSKKEGMEIRSIACLYAKQETKKTKRRKANAKHKREDICGIGRGIGRENTQGRAQKGR